MAIKSRKILRIFHYLKYGTLFLFGAALGYLPSGNRAGQSNDGSLLDNITLYHVANADIMQGGGGFCPPSVECGCCEGTYGGVGGVGGGIGSEGGEGSEGGGGK